MIISPKSDINLREENQDVFGHYDTPYGSLLIVCDGMGGAKAGHAAADYTTSRFPQLLQEAHARAVPVRTALVEAAKEINRYIFELSRGDREYKGMGTTLVFGLSSMGGFLVGHVGDSRAYLLHHGELTPLTQDHAPVAEMLLQGIITEEQARNHPRRSVLSRAIGPLLEAPLELREDIVPFEPGDSLILCSDGLCGFVSNNEMAALLNSLPDQRAAATALVNLAKERGSDDNITVLIAHEPVPVASPPSSAQPSHSRPAAATTSAKSRSTAAPSSAKMSTLSARNPSPANDLLEELASPPTRNTLVVLGLCLLLGCLLTWSHYTDYYQVTDFTPIEEEEEVATDVETLDDYDWTRSDCPISFAGQAKSMFNDFEQELRRSTTLSIEEEMDIGRNLAAQFESEYYGMIDTDAKWTQYIRSVGNILVDHVNREQIVYRFHLVEDPLENAFAFPGGHIYIFRGLLKRYIKTEAQLAFVLAHEIKHVDNRHAIAFERLIRRIPTNIRDAAGGSLGYFINQPFSSNREEEADFEGLRLMMAAGYSPCQAAVFVQKMVPVEITPLEGDIWDTLTREAAEFFSTHPNLVRRECQVRNEVIHLLHRSENKPLYVGAANFRQRVCKDEVLF